MFQPAQVTLASASITVGILGGLVAVGISVFEYRLKTRAQTAEIDVALARLFSELVPIANGRREAVISEAAAAAIAGQKELTPGELDKMAVVHIGVGEATQAAAIASLGYLGRTYPALRAAAEAALDGLDYVKTPSLVRARDGALHEVASSG